MKKILFTILGVLLLASCGNKNIVDEERTFSKGVWNHFTPEVFEVNVNNTEDYYNIDMTATVDTSLFRYQILPLTVNIYSPNGERRMFYVSIQTKENGRWKGEKKGDKREITTRVRTFFSFNSTGTHRIEVAQATSQYDLEGIGSFRLTIENTEIDYGDL